VKVDITATIETELETFMQMMLIGLMLEENAKLAPLDADAEFPMWDIILGDESNKNTMYSNSQNNTV
jgi:hypothetical protein